MTTTAQLEREAEETRSQIADTLQELRTRMTPGEVVDQLFDYARDGGGGMFLRNLGQQVTDNPIPVALMGAGLAWLMMGGRGPSARSLSEASRRVRNTMSDTGEWMAQAGRCASEAV